MRNEPFSYKLKIKLRWEEANCKNKFQQKQPLVLKIKQFSKLNHINKKLEVATEPRIRKKLKPDLIFFVRASCLKNTCEGINSLLKETTCFKISPQFSKKLFHTWSSKLLVKFSIFDKFTNKVNHSSNWHDYRAIIFRKPLCMAAWQFNY